MWIDWLQWSDDAAKRPEAVSSKHEFVPPTRAKTDLSDKSRDPVPQRAKTDLTEDYREPAPETTPRPKKSTAKPTYLSSRATAKPKTQARPKFSHAKVAPKPPTKPPPLKQRSSMKNVICQVNVGISTGMSRPFELRQGETPKDAVEAFAKIYDLDARMQSRLLRLLLKELSRLNLVDA